ncbi:MAG: hypothetical protein OXB98_17340 [Bryobacterales bacterium]|nr:hypothetical protein [Bryobacterales bacterium]
MEALRSSNIDDTLIDNAVDEIRDMAGSNVFDALNTLDAKLTGALQTELAHLRGDLNTRSAEVRTNRWILSMVLVLSVAFGLFKG